MKNQNNADCRVCGRKIRGFDDICLSCWNALSSSKNDEPRTWETSGTKSPYDFEDRRAA
jgi:hypothetical protein